MKATLLLGSLLLVITGCGTGMEDSTTPRTATTSGDKRTHDMPITPASCVEAISMPACDGILSRIMRNSIRIEYSDDVTVAQLNSIKVRELQSSGQFGADIAHEFLIVDEGGGFVTLQNNGIWLENATWYAVTDSCNQFDFLVKYGDVDGDGETDALDVNTIWRHAGSGDPSFDVNGDGVVDMFDAQLAWKYRDVHVHPTPLKPTGHDCQQ